MRPLAVIGNVNVDLIMGPVAPWPRPGTEVMVPHDDLRVGGAAGNTALAWQALDVPFQFAASIGSDTFGQWLAKAFPTYASSWPVSPRRTTVSVGLTHPDGERTFFTTDGHLRDMDAKASLAALNVAPLSGGILLLTGAFVTDALANDYSRIFDWADAHGIEVALDTGWPVQGWTAETRAKARGWLARSKLALLNEAETAALTEIDDIHQAAAALRHAMPKGAIVVVKRGAEGALALDAVATHRASAKAVTVIDTIGAGDIFNAGFLVAHAWGLGLHAALQAGVATASVAISTHPRRFLQQDLTE